MGTKGRHKYQPFRRYLSHRQGITRYEMVVCLLFPRVVSLPVAFSFACTIMDWVTRRVNECVGPIYPEVVVTSVRAGWLRVGAEISLFGWSPVAEGSVLKLGTYWAYTGDTLRVEDLWINDAATQLKLYFESIGESHIDITIELSPDTISVQPQAVVVTEGNPYRAEGLIRLCKNASVRFHCCTMRLQLDNGKAEGEAV